MDNSSQQISYLLKITIQSFSALLYFSLSYNKAHNYGKTISSHREPIIILSQFFKVPVQKFHDKPKVYVNCWVSYKTLNITNAHVLMQTSHQIVIYDKTLNKPGMTRPIASRQNYGSRQSFLQISYNNVSNFLITAVISCKRAASRNPSRAFSRAHEIFSLMSENIHYSCSQQF